MHPLCRRVALVVGRQQRLQPVIITLHVIIDTAKVVICGILGDIGLTLKLDPSCYPIEGHQTGAR